MNLLTRKNHALNAKEILIIPYPNVHTCRLRNPSDFDNMRSRSQAHEGKQYQVVYGTLKSSGKTEDQSYRYRKTTWDEAEARSHCRSHGGTFHPAIKKKGITMAQISKEELSFINKRFAKKALKPEEVFGFEATVANAVNVTSYYTRFTRRTLEAFEQSINEKGVAMGVMHQNQLPPGRLYSGKVSGAKLKSKFYCLRDMQINSTVGAMGIASSNTISTNDMERMIDAGTLFDVSVGFQADRERYICNICKNSIVDFEKCQHMPGKTYDKQKCIAIIDDTEATLHEVSPVMAGALPGAEVHTYAHKKEWNEDTLKNNTNIQYLTYQLEEDVDMNELEEVKEQLSLAEETIAEKDREIAGLDETISLLKETLDSTSTENVEAIANAHKKIEELNAKCTELEAMAKIGKHYDAYVESEIMRLGVAVEGDEFDKNLQKKLLLGLTIEEKESIRDNFEKRAQSMFKKGALPEPDRSKVTHEDDSIYKV